MQQETAAQTLLRTALRYYKIRHLDFETKKRLMAIAQEEFEDEFLRINSGVAYTRNEYLTQRRKDAKNSFAP